MKEKKKLLFILAAFVILLAGAYGLYNKLGQEVEPDQVAAEKEEENPKAPDFAVFDLDGNAVYLSDYIGKPIVLNFWASWCGPCKMELPDFEEKYKELGDEVQFLIINMTDGSRETVETASGFIQEQGYTLPVFYDTQSEAAAAYNIFSLPTTYFIDSEGYVISKATGAIDGETLQKGIDSIYGARNEK